MITLTHVQSVLLLFFKGIVAIFFLFWEYWGTDLSSKCFIIYLQSSIPVFIYHMTKCHDWILLLDLINPISWFDLISSILWFNLISYILWYESIKSYLLIQFNCFRLTVLPFASPYKLVKDDPNKIPDNIIV